MLSSIRIFIKKVFLLDGQDIKYCTTGEKCMYPYGECTKSCEYYKEEY